MVLLCVQPAPHVVAQTPAAKSASRDRALSIARELVASARYASLGTIDSAGRPQARLVDPLAPDAAFEVYFATNPASRKVAEIRRDARVSLLYFDPARLGYVTLVGRAVEVGERERPKHHKSEWQSFFPREKPATYLLYRVIPERLEVSSPRDGLAGDPVTWRPEIVTFP